MSDHYQTLAGEVEGRFKVDRSDFLAIGFPCDSESFFAEELSRIQKLHFDATHHCWAFRLRERARTSDAGEPSGTAGKPILAAIEGASLVDVAVIVVRWYGGIKLGTGGLSRAYRNTAAEALKLAVRVDRYLYREVRVTAPFDALGTIYRLVDPPNVVLRDEAFGDENVFTFDVRLSRCDAFVATLREYRLAFSIAPA